MSFVALTAFAAVAVYAVYSVVAEPPLPVQRALFPLRYDEAIRRASAEYGVEPAFAAGVVYAESRFRADAVSDKNAYGLMQITPATAEFIRQNSGIRGDFRDPQVNIRMGTWYLSYLEDRYVGDERLMLAAYNSGVGSVDGWISAEDFDVRSDIPYKETREYVETVLEARERYRELYGRDLNRDP